MTRPSVRLAVSAGLCATLCHGCGAPPKDAGFADVQRLVGERIDKDLAWKRGDPEDAEVDRRVRALLAHELSADEAVQVALLNNASLQAVYEDLGVSQAEVVQAGLLHNPVFAASARFPDKPPSGTNLEFSVVQDFLDVLMLPARKDLAARQFEAEKLRVADAVLTVAAEARTAYYTLQAAMQTRAVMREIADAAEASHELAQRMADAGNTSELMLVSERALYEQSMVDVARAEAEILASRERLTTLMGLWGPDLAWTIPARLPDLPAQDPALERIESIAIAHRLDLAAAGRDVEVRAQALGLIRDWRWIASVELGVSSERDTDGQWMTGPAIALELPIFDQRQAGIARAEALLRRSEQRLRALAIEIRSQARAVSDRMTIARDVAEHYRSVLVPLRERIVSLTMERYNYMLVGVAEALAARREQSAAYRGAIESVRDYWIARSELARIAGGRLDGPDAAPGEPDAAPARDEPPQAHQGHTHGG